MGVSGIIVTIMGLVVSLMVITIVLRISNNERQAKLQSSINSIKNTTDKSTSEEDTTAKGNSMDKATTSTTQKQETKETQAPTVVNNITNNQNEYKTVVIHGSETPAKQDNSFLSNLGSNLIAELVVAILFAGLTWFIRDYLKLRKHKKLNINKD
jgi:hypothetical protein